MVLAATAVVPGRTLPALSTHTSVPALGFSVLPVTVKPASASVLPLVVIAVYLGAPVGVALVMVISTSVLVASLKLASAALVTFTFTVPTLTGVSLPVASMVASPVPLVTV